MVNKRISSLYCSRSFAPLAFSVGDSSVPVYYFQIIIGTFVLPVLTLFLAYIFMDLIKRPTPWFSFINPMIYNELRHYSTMFSQVSGSIPPPSSTDSRLMVILWLKPAFSSTVWMVGESHTGVSSQNRAL